MPSPELFASIINSYLPEPHASLLNGIIFGINLRTSKEFYEQIKTVGLLHIVVLSGSNINLIGFLIMGLTRSLNKKVSIVLTIVTITLFVLFVGPEPPIVRAAIMGIISFMALLFGRKASALYSLLLSALVVGLLNKEWLTSISFQLSFFATLGIILFASPNGQSPHRGIARYLFDEFRTSLSAQVFTAPLIFIHFKEVSLISPIANICVSWTIFPLMVFGFATAILGFLNRPLGRLFAYLCYGFLTYVILIIETLASIPYVFFSF